MNIKPLAAVVSLLAAGSVAAGEIYATDTNTVELSGWAKAVGLYVNTDNVDKESHVFTDAHLKVKATHFLNEETKVIGSFAINTGDSAGDRTAKFDDIKLEFDHTGFGNLSLGDTGNSFGAIEKAHSGEGSDLYKVSQGGVDGQGVRYKKTINNLELSANYETDSKHKEVKAGEKPYEHDSNYAFSANYKGEDFTVAAAYGSDGTDANSYGVAADVKFGSLKLGAAYIAFENAGSLKANDSVEITLKSPNDGETYSLAATYTIDVFRIYGSVQYAEGDYLNKAFDAQTAYLGLGYDVTKEFKTDFVLQTGEIDNAGVKEDGSAVKFVAKYSF